MTPSSITRSIKLSSFAGVAKVICQISVALIVFPVIVLTGGAEALGAWVMLQLTVGYFGLTNFGLGTALTRTIASSDDDDGAPYVAVFSTIIFGLAVASLLFLILLVFSDGLAAVISDGLANRIDPTSIWLVYIAVVFRLASSIIGAIIAGQQRTDLVQLSHALQLVIFIVATIELTARMQLFAALSLAFVSSYTLELIFVAIMAARIKSRSAIPRRSCSWNDVRSFLVKSTSFSAVDISLLIREPILKLAIFIAGGAEPVGFYEIASKIPSTIRQGFVQGLSSLMPAFAHLFGKGEIQTAIALGRMTLVYIILGAVGSLSIYYFNAEFLIRLWLGQSNDLLLSFTYVSTFWWMVSSFNVPAWWLGIGVGQVWRSAAVVWIHLVFACFVLLFAYLGYVDPLQSVLLWTVGGVVMQVFLYANVSRMTKIVGVMYLHRSVFTAICVVTVSTLAMIFVPELVLAESVDGNLMSVAKISFFVATHIVLILGANSIFNLGLFKSQRGDV